MHAWLACVSRWFDRVFFFFFFSIRPVGTCHLPLPLPLLISHAISFFSLALVFVTASLVKTERAGLFMAAGGAAIVNRDTEVGL